LNYLESAIERAVLLAFAQHAEKHGASSMTDLNGNILDQAENTTKTLLGIKDEMFKQNLKHRQLEAEQMYNINSMTGMIPPMPIAAPKKSPRVTTNEDMLLSENEALKGQLVEKSDAMKALDLRLKEAYELVQQFREEFEKSVAELNSKVYGVQTEVFKVLGGEVAPK
jgi:hypothetical protein